MKTFLPAFAFFIFLFFFHPFLAAQNPLPTPFVCGGDVMQQQLWKKHPELAAAQANLDAQLAQVFRQKENGTAARAAAAPLVLPVVVHIIHNGGSENINDAQVADAVQHLNDAFAHTGYFAKAGAGVETGIQFCLARRTPDGLPTTGINRVVSPLTQIDMETDDISLKNLIRWDPTRYVNIWVVQSINSLSSGPGVAGYAYFPTSHGRPEDGMVCEAQFFGVSPERDAVFIHEMGHYLNLYHTFEGGCKNDDCLIDGDRVCDTPPDQAKHTACPYNSCTTDTDAPAPNPFTTDGNDMTENFMDYSPFECVYRFTQGQTDRMQEAVKTIRKSLLESNGCKDACSPMVHADFSVTPASGGVAGVVANFNNNTTGGVSYQWFVNGSLVSTAINPAYTFNFPGVFSIKLLATNGPQGCVDSFSMPYIVTCPVEASYTADKTSIKEGESVLFTSTSTGGGTLEWFINGISVGSGPSLNFTFPTEGTFNIVLRATGAVCSDDFSGEIQVTGDCEAVMEQLQFSATNRLLFLDMQNLPNGNIIACGRADLVGKGVVSLFGPNGNVIWSKGSQQVETWVEVQNLPDGTFALLGNQEVGVATTPVVAHLDANGNLLQFLNFNYAAPSPLSLFDEIEQMVIDPDGSLTMTATHNNSDLAVIKFRLDGTIVWSKLFKKTFRGDWMKATDGSNGYLLGRKSQNNYEVFKLNINGEVLQGKAYKPTSSIVSAVDTYSSLAAHPDGGYAIACKTPVSPIEFKTNLLRCEASGNITWSNHYITTGVSLLYQNLAYFKDDGWFLGEQGGFDNNFNVQSSVLLRIEESGSLRWHKKFTNANAGIGSLQILTGKQAGRLRLLATHINITSSLLASIPDANGAANCLIESTETTTLTNQHTYDVMDASPLISENLAVTISTGNLILTNLSLNKKVICTTLPPCPEICDNGKDDDKDGYVDCYDTDCHCFDGQDCLADNLDPDATIEGKLVWRTGEGLACVNSSPIVANLNPQTDSIAEIIVIRANSPIFRIYKGDGSDVATPSLLPPMAGFAWNGNYPVIGDINKDGIPEFITVENDSKVRVYRNFTPGVFPCMTVWMTSDQPTADTKQRPMLADFDQDGVPEVYAGNDVFRFDFSNPAVPQLRLTLNGLSHSGSSTLATNVSTAVDLLSPADCNGDPDCEGLELVAGSVIYSIDLDLSDGDGFQIKVARDLNTMQPVKYGDGYTAVADMDLNGIPDIVVSGPPIYIWNKNGLVRQLTVPPGPIGFSYRGVAAIANVYDDTKSGYAKDYPEIIMIGAKTMACFNLNKANTTPAAPYWWVQPNSDESGYTGCTTFDFNGDGIQEIVYRDQSDLRIMYGGAAPFPPGVDAERNWWKTTVGSVTLDEIPVIADVNNDSHADIAVTGFDKPFAGSQPSTYDGRLHVFTSAKIPWMPCRPMWNQFNYNHVNINDDLTVPRVQQKHWLEFPGPGGGKYPFNTALAQLSQLNSKFTTGYPVPDVVVTLDTVFCAPNGLSLQVHICNSGSVAFPDSVPLQFYGKNPTATAVTPYGAPFFLKGKLDKDSCHTWSIDLPMPPDGTLWGVVNDNGSLSTPFDLTKNFPSTAQPECNYVNNIFSLNVSSSTATLDLGPDRSLCSSSVLTLHADTGFARYRWNDGSPDSTFTAFGPGKYWVDAWDICGKKYSDTLRITLQNTSFELGPDRSICRGDSVLLALTGFDQVQWSPRPIFGCPDCASVHLAPDSSVVLRVSGQVGNCIVSDSMRVHVQDFPEITSTVTPGKCLSGTGSIVVTATGGNSGLIFKWESGQNTATLDSLSAGTYRVTVSNASGCSVSKSYEVLAGDAPLLADTAYTAIRCFSEKNGGISVTPAGGAAPYNFTWSHDPTATGNSQAALAAGAYSLTITDGNGCSSTASFQLAEPPALALTAVIDSTSCQKNTASISASGAGGTAPYVYAWNTGAKTPDLNNQPPGLYNVVLTDANGCTSTQAFEVKPGGSLLLSDTSYTSIRCFSEKNGGISVTPAGGVAPYHFIWSHDPTATGNSQTALAAGTYGLTITDTNGCSSTATFQLPQPPALLLAATIDSTDCLKTTASISMSATGGSGPYTYTWNTGAKTSELNNQPPGLYSVVATDANGCTSTRSFEVKPGGSPILTDTIYTAVRCFSEKNGGISVAPTGGTTPYMFTWSNNPAVTGNSQSNLAAGNYYLTITDTNGCSSTASFQLTEPPALVLTATMDSTDCQKITASMAASAAGGTAPYTYTWNTGAKTPDLNNQPPGLYSVVATDANGCTSTHSFEVKPGGSPLLTDTSLTNIRCFSEKNGGIAVTPAGGIAPYHFAWSNDPAATSNSQTALAAGAYSLTITDKNGCSTTASFQLSEPPALVLGATMDSTDCQKITASMAANAAGGTAPYTYAWNTGAKTPDLNNQPPGLYNVVLTDANGCTSSLSFEVKPGGSPLLTDTVYTAIRCYSEKNGGIAVTPAGGTAPYQFTWSNNPAATGSSQAALAAGVYGLTITDTKGCSSTAQFHLSEPPALVLTATMDSTNCQKITASITTTATGGTMPYHHLWNTGATTPDLNNQPPGLYSVALTDANGCTSTRSFEVKPGGSPAVTLTGGHISCLQSSAILTAGPVLSNYNFEWTNPDGNLLNGPQQQVSQAGIYQVTVTDLNSQCSATSTIEVQQAAALTGLSWMADSVSCFGFEDGTLTVSSVQGGTGPFEYSIENHTFTSEPVFGQLAAGVYTLQVRDAEGCTFEQTVQVSEPAPLTVVLTASDTVVRKGALVELIASIQPPDRFLTSITWQPLGRVSSNGLTAEASVAGTTAFQVQVADENGCTADDSVQIKVKQAGFYFPNVIAPDRPNNGGFTIYADHPDVKVKWLRVYSRWGELIFERTNFPAGDATLGWQGDYKGQKVQVGVYIFTATLVLEDGSEEQLEGDITVF